MDNAWLKMMFKMSTATLHTSVQTTTRLTNRCCDVTVMSSLSTALSSKQENIYPSACLVHCDGACQKLRNQMQNYLKYTNKTSGTFFSGQCNLRLLSTKVLQGRGGTCVNYGRIFIDFFTANLLQSVKVKKIWKSVSISRSYRQK